MPLEHPLLRGAGVPHGFGLRDEAPPGGLLHPVQMHGASVVRAGSWRAERPEADAIVAAGEVSAPIGVVTADCVPVLATSDDGRAVAAIHAGWRGLAAGVIEAGIAALHAECGGRTIVAAIGPHIGPCCYEVDAPVLDALRASHGAGLDAALRPARPGHWWLDLGTLARAALAQAGLPTEAIGGLEEVCTSCDLGRFHSYRRDGPRSGRLVHWISCRPRKAD